MATADVLDKDVRVTITADTIPSIFRSTIGCGYAFDPMFVLDEIERAARLPTDWIDPINEPEDPSEFIQEWHSARHETIYADNSRETEHIGTVGYDFPEDIPRFPRLAKLAFWRRWTRR
jgi:hypothetical protein